MSNDTLASYGVLVNGFSVTDKGDGTSNVYYTAPQPAGQVAETSLASPAAETNVSTGELEPAPAALAPQPGQ